VIDGLGDGRPWSVYRGERLLAAGDIRKGSIGWGIREAGKHLGVQAGHFNDIAGKVMGLQAHGRIDQGYLGVLRGMGIDRVGEIWSLEAWSRWRGDTLLGRLSLLDWVATVHARTGELLVEFFSSYANRDEPISYSGGVAQNVVWNSLLRDHFPNISIAPHCSDEGLSLGGLEWLRRKHGLPPLEMPSFPFAQCDTGVQPPSEKTLDAAARLLAGGRVVGWYQGQGEIGPRALGNRSILMDPRMPDGRARIDRIKRREPYRPYGASVLEERFDNHFSGHADPFMLYTCRVSDESLSAITHCDGTSRVQRVDHRNPSFRALLEKFEQVTGCPVLLNTSLNVAGKPLAAYPEHAAQVFFESSIDALFVGDALYRK
jgi:carbamoyltransferase